MDFTSKVPKNTFPTTLKAQLNQLKTDELMLRFDISRQALSLDPYRPIYHYVNPEGNLNDPNGLCFWNGLYHLFYQAYPPEDPRQHWGHAISEDLVHWKDLPLAIYPNPEEKCFSGTTLVEKDRVIAMYHGIGQGNMIAISKDPLLLNWDKLSCNPVIPNPAQDKTEMDTDKNSLQYRVYDPCIWKDNNIYYSLSGSYSSGTMFDDCKMTQFLFSSKDLNHWKYLGEFIEGNIFTLPGEDGAVPYFLPIADKHILLFASHKHGSQYLLGNLDRENYKFKPFTHGRFNFGKMTHGGVHAPSATSDTDGTVLLIHNINEGRPTKNWNHIMSLVRRISIDPQNKLQIAPVKEIESIRSNHKQIHQSPLPANQDILLENIEGNSLELIAVIDPKDAREICINVLRSPNSDEYTSVKFLKRGYNLVSHWLKENKSTGTAHQDALIIDTSRSSLLPDILARTPEIAPFELKDGEKLTLRIFIDKSVIEVFANDRQCLAVRVYPKCEDSVYVSIRASGNNAILQSLNSWSMGNIWAR